MLDGQKILDMHAHTNAPPELYAYKAGLLSSRGYHGKGNPNISDDRLAGAVKRGLDIMDSVGTDIAAVGEVESRSVPRTDYLGPLQVAFGKRRAAVRTGVIDREEGAVNVEQRQPALTDLNGYPGPGWHVFRLGDLVELSHQCVLRCVQGTQPSVV